MKTYFVEKIGAQFADKDIKSLAALFDKRAKEGFELHSVFQITQPTGCLNTGSPIITNLAIYESSDE